MKFLFVIPEMPEEKKAGVECVYTSVGCNRSPHCVAWHGGTALYGACCAVAVVKANKVSLACLTVKLYYVSDQRIS